MNAASCSNGPTFMVPEESATSHKTSATKPPNTMKIFPINLIRRAPSNTAIEVLLHVANSGGADRDRTGGLLVANQALSQLSYSPLNPVVSLRSLVVSKKPRTTND